MADTQWPRFMVFQKEAEGKTFVHNGTVHAADIEMALLNARDVFARRPDAVALWVVPADLIYTQTREEIAGWPAREIESSLNPTIVYCVFGKFEQQAQCRFIGEVQAGSPQAAIQDAVAKYANEQPLWWWVFPKSAILSSQAEDKDPMFAPAREKTYKDQAEYPVVTMMRQLRAGKKLDKNERG